MDDQAAGQIGVLEWMQASSGKVRPRARVRKEQDECVWGMPRGGKSGAAVCVLRGSGKDEGVGVIPTTVL